jgi:hypothetical protein
MDCQQMVPIVNGLKKRYSSCMQLERVNFHDHTHWHELLSPLASPEFVLLTSSGDPIHRWFGVTQEAEFSAILDPLCG